MGFSSVFSIWKFSGAPSDVVLSFLLISDRIYDRFFGFRSFFLFFPIVFTFVFRFPIVFSVSSGAIRLHKRIHGRDSAPRAYSQARFGSTQLVTQRDSAQISGTLDQVRAQSYLKGNTRY